MDHLTSNLTHRWRMYTFRCEMDWLHWEETKWTHLPSSLSILLVSMLNLFINTAVDFHFKTEQRCSAAAGWITSFSRNQRLSSGDWRLRSADRKRRRCFHTVNDSVCVCVVPDGGLAESTPLRDRMALYQAAISKQEVTPSSVSVSVCNTFNLPTLTDKLYN